MAKRWEVEQRAYAAYGPRAGELLEVVRKRYRFKWVAAAVAWLCSGHSISGLIALETQVTDLTKT